MEVGPGGKQIQLEDPDGNPIELFAGAVVQVSVIEGCHPERYHSVSCDRLGVRS
jgi:hypothetical protein